jgi:hypothetical protein
MMQQTIFRQPKENSNQNDFTVFKRVKEPKENAFSILIPKDGKPKAGFLG